ncbi:MAG: hypothetical protein ACREAA_10970 [Candidatus Polarisedimenticolia bacterium]
MRRKLNSFLLTTMALGLLFVSGATTIVTMDQSQDVVSAQPLAAETSCDKSNTTPAAVVPDETNAVCRICPIMEGCNLIFCTTKVCCYNCGGEIACIT